MADDADAQPPPNPTPPAPPAAAPPPARPDRDIGYLVDMLENVRRAIEHVAGRDWAAFQADRVLQDAVAHRLLIVGEAVRNVSQATRLQLPGIPWRNVNAMRNILVHDYKGVELKYVWEVIGRHGPEMVRLIQAYLDARNVRPDPTGPA